MSKTQYSFGELLDEFEVRIPIIQRDYAQGREQEYAVRAGFISALIQSLRKRSGMKLDFVYGKTQTECGRRVFLPLDGQQRLTTLALIYWYFGAVSTERSWRFVYKSRRMAMRFVEELFSDRTYDGSELPSAWIARQTFFSPAWTRDPTVKGMMVMLDDLHRASVGMRFTREDLDRITFFVHFCPKEISEDETYLKINARGEPLTRWENVKSILDARARALTRMAAFADDASAWIDHINGDWESWVESKLPLLSAERDLSDKELAFYIALSVELMNGAFQNVIDLAAMMSVDEQKIGAWVVNERERLGMSFDEKGFGVAMLGTRTGADSVRDEHDLYRYLVGAFHSHSATYEDYRNPLILPDTVFFYIKELFGGLKAESWDAVRHSWSKNRAESYLWHRARSEVRVDCLPRDEFAAGRDFLFAGVKTSGASLESESSRKEFDDWVSAGYKHFFKASQFEYADGIRFALLARCEGREFATTRVLNVLDYLEVPLWEESFQTNCQLLLKAQEEGIGVLSDGCGFKINNKKLVRKVIEEESVKFKLYEGGDRSFLAMEIRHGLTWGMIRFAFDDVAKRYSLDYEALFDRDFYTGESPESCIGFMKLLEYLPEDVHELWMPQHLGAGECAARDLRWFLYDDQAYLAYKGYVTGAAPVNASWLDHYKKLIHDRHRPYSKLNKHWSRWGRDRVFAYDGTNQISKNAICLQYSDGQIEKIKSLLNRDCYFVNFDDVYEEGIWDRICAIMKDL